LSSPIFSNFALQLGVWENKRLLSQSRIFKTWWPLAASWLLMSIELPAMSAVVARLPNAEVNLAAYGGIVFPLAMIIESPIIMLLAASTALSKDWGSYLKMRRFMMVTSAVMTAVHILVAFTPLYDLVARHLLGVPAEIIEPGRVGLMIMLPWTWAIAYRRFNQGVLIRFEHSQTIGVGTGIRIGANLIVLTIGFLTSTIPGIVVATSAVICGVVSEAIYVGIVVRPVLKNELKLAPPLAVPLTFAAFMDFYIPLAMTSLLILLVQPIGSAAISRMPRAIESLAAWSVVSGLTFMVRSPGIAYNEVVVALLDRPRSSASLLRFALILISITSLLLLVVTATPLAWLWFSEISGLNPELASLAKTGLWLTLPGPALAVLQSWYQGAVLHDRRTRGIIEAVVIFLITSTAVLWAGAAWGKVTGLYVALAAFSAAGITQTLWLWSISRPAIRAARQRDAVVES
jgi:hypothetical protein